MSFTDAFEPKEVHSDENPSVMLWYKTAGFSVINFVVIALVLMYQRNMTGAELINSSSAWAAVVLIGLSMLLSAICYFWNAFDHYILFRKHIGISGFVMATIHVFFSLVVMRHDFPFPSYYLSSENVTSFMFAVAAFAYFAFMTLISNNRAVHDLGGARWRKLLRVGYVAYIFATIHFALKGFPYWVKWIQSGMQKPPSLGLILFIFALFVPYFRVILEIALRQQKRINQDS